MIMAYSGASLALTIVAIGLWGGAAFAISSAQQARLVNQNPHLASATLALNTSALYIGQAGGAMLGGITISLAGVQNLHWAGAALLAAALAASVWESLLPASASPAERPVVIGPEPPAPAQRAR
jgi:predicted MFS family arabinose efflux permease